MASRNASACHFRSTPINGHRQTGQVGPVRAKRRPAAGSKVWLESLSGRILEAETYYSIRAATDRRVSPEPFQARADELSRVEA